MKDTKIFVNGKHGGEFAIRIDFKNMDINVIVDDRPIAGIHIDGDCMPEIEESIDRFVTAWCGPDAEWDYVS